MIPAARTCELIGILPKGIVPEPLAGNAIGIDYGRTAPHGRPRDAEDDELTNASTSDGALVV